MARLPGSTEFFYAAGQTECQTWVTYRDFENAPKKQQQFAAVKRVFNFIPFLI